MTYTEFVARVASLMVEEPSDAQFLAILPAMIDYAEQRIYRELNLAATSTEDTTGTLSPGLRAFTPAKHFIVIQQVNIAPGTVSKAPLMRVTRDFLDAAYASAATTGKPKYYALLSDQTVAVGPWPDTTYTFEVVGTVRPAPLSATNATTVLTLYLPDLFLAAAMIFASGYQKNFGAQSDDPRQALSWETLYQSLKGSADMEEVRKKAMAPAPSPPSGD